MVRTAGPINKGPGQAPLSGKGIPRARPASIPPPVVCGDPRPARGPGPRSHCEELRPNPLPVGNHLTPAEPVRRAAKSTVQPSIPRPRGASSGRRAGGGRARRGRAALGAHPGQMHKAGGKSQTRPTPRIPPNPAPRASLQTEGGGKKRKIKKKSKQEKGK